MDVFTHIKQIIIEILDIDNDDIQPETYLIRELGAESIDLLELAVSLNSEFKVEVKDSDIFLGRLRNHLSDAEEKGIEPTLLLMDKFPFLSEERIKELLADLESGPVLKVKDLSSYILWKLQAN